MSFLLLHPFLIVHDFNVGRERSQYVCASNQSISTILSRHPVIEALHSVTQKAKQKINSDTHFDHVMCNKMNVYVYTGTEEKYFHTARIS